MRYQSTRGGAANLSFTEAVMTGLAPDGGLLVPADIPDVSAKLDAWSSLHYCGVANAVMSLFIEDIAPDALTDLIARSYASFDHPEVTPVFTSGELHVLELFHGPTLAFKDVALQFLGNTFDYVLKAQGEHLNILGATSGDTGSAAIAGVRGRDNVDIFVMFPDGRTSPLQERQMTTVPDANVHALAIEGSFDDCQSILKAIFRELDFKAEYSLGAVNSVNWARVLAQVVYYFVGYFRVGHDGPIDVCVPTGNFGNIFAAYVARKMGLPLRRLVLATNANDILARFFRSGRYSRGDVHFSLSPSMDIQVSSNFERYLFYNLGCDPVKVRSVMETFEATGDAQLNFNTRVYDEAFAAGTADDAATLGAIGRTWAEHQYLLDPHTAVGVAVAEDYRAQAGDNVPMLCVATAHPAKFPDCIADVLPGVPATHPTLQALESLPTRKTVLPADVDAVKSVIRDARR